MKFKSLPDTTQLSAFYLDCNMLNLHSPSQSISGVLSTALLASSIPTWMPFRLFTNTSNELPSLSKYQLFPQSGRHPTCIAPQIHGIQLPLRDIIFSSPAVDSLGTWLIFHSSFFNSLLQFYNIGYLIGSCFIMWKLLTRIENCHHQSALAIPNSLPSSTPPPRHPLRSLQIQNLLWSSGVF